MKLMSCFGNFRKGDRTCEMCEMSCCVQYMNCKMIKNAENNLRMFSNSYCSYKYEEFSYSERESFIKCRKYGGCCNPKTKCRKDEYDEKVKEFNRLKENLRKGIENL